MGCVFNNTSVSFFVNKERVNNNVVKFALASLVRKRPSYYLPITKFNFSASESDTNSIIFSASEDVNLDFVCAA